MIAMEVNARFNSTKLGMQLGYAKDMQWIEMHMRMGEIRAYVDERLTHMWALRVKDAIKIALTQNDSDLGATLMIAKAIYSANDGLEVMPYSWPETRFGHVIQTSQPFKPMVVGLALVDAKLFLDGIKPTEDFHLHDHHCFEHFLCVVFSHVVFLQLVDGGRNYHFSGWRRGFLFVGAAMNQYAVRTSMVLRKPFQKAFPTVELPGVIRSPAFDRGVVIGWLAQPFNERRIHSGDFGRFTIVINQRVFRCLLQKPLISMASATALKCLFFRLYYKIQNSTDSHNNPANARDYWAACGNACKSGASPKQAGEFENVGHAVKKAFLKLHITYCIRSVASRFINRSFICSYLFRKAPAHASVPLFRLLRRRWRWCSSRRYMVMPAFFFTGHTNRFEFFHGSSPVVVIKQDSATFSLHLATHERPPFLSGGAP